MSETVGTWTGKCRECGCMTTVTPLKDGSRYEDRNGQRTRVSAPVGERRVIETHYANHAVRIVVELTNYLDDDLARTFADRLDLEIRRTLSRFRVSVSDVEVVPTQGE